MKTTSTWPKNAWKPIRSGRLYCSPACGGGCTHAAFSEATAKAKILCAKMGKGWDSEVWENLGWHYSVISPCGRIKIHGNGNSFTALLGELNSPGGRYAETAKTAKQSLKAVCDEARKDLAKLGATINDLPA